MHPHYPFDDVTIAGFEATGITFATRERVTSIREALETWPLANLPHSLPGAPDHALHPDDCIAIAGNEFAGRTVAAAPFALMVELDAAATLATSTDGNEQFAACAVVALRLDGRIDAPDAPPLVSAQLVNTSLQAFARCAVLFSAAYLACVEVSIAKPDDAASQRTQIVQKFLARASEIDDASPYWRAESSHLEDTGPAFAFISAALAGRAALPTR